MHAYKIQCTKESTEQLEDLFVFSTPSDRTTLACMKKYTQFAGDVLKDEYIKRHFKSSKTTGLPHYIILSITGLTIIYKVTTGSVEVKVMVGTIYDT